MRKYVVAICSLVAIAGASCSAPTVGPPSTGQQRPPTALYAATSGYRETVLHRFKGRPDAANPESGVILDAAGDPYGTTTWGGAYDSCPGGYGIGCGTVFELDKAGNERIVYSFGPRPDAHDPVANVTLKDGDLYGTTAGGGGDYSCYGSDADGCGTVFKIDQQGNETLLYTFKGNFGSGKVDGENPEAGLVADSAGNFYGTTTNGGKYQRGTIFKVTKDGKETVLYSFTGGTDGGRPNAGLVRDTAGNLYGVAYIGGPTGCNGGCGTIFEFIGGKSLTTLYNFKGKGDGSNPMGGLVRDAGGDLFGTTQTRGNLKCTKVASIPGCGTVFEFDAAHKFKVLHVFNGSPDGAIPEETLTRDGKGDVYGTTSFGGDSKCSPGDGCGVVFEINAQGKESILHTFTGGKNDGAVPFSGLARDSTGNLYGTTVGGGVGCFSVGCGIVFKLSPRT